MLVIVITIEKLIANRKFNVDTGSVLVCGITGNNKIIVKSNIVEASTRAGVGDVKELLIEALLGRIKDANNTANNTDTNKIIATRGPKREICILPVLIVVISASRFIINRGI